MWVLRMPIIPAIFIEDPGKRHNHNVAKFGTPGQGKNFRKEERS
jgi:hypothetical protein